MSFLLRLILVSCLVPGAGAASVLTEDEFLAVLDETHPAMLVLEGEQAEAEAAVREAFALANPELRVEREAWGEPAQQTTLALGWSPPLDGQRGPRRAAARAGLEAARHRRDAERLRVRAEAREAYADWWLAEERSSTLTRQSAYAREIADRVRRRADSGEESGLAARRFELAALRLEAELARAHVERARARAALRTWHGGDDPGWEPARPDLPPAADGLRWESRPDVLSLRAAVRSAEEQRKSAGRVLTFPSLEFGWVWQDGEEPGVDGPLAGLAWTVPLFDRKQAERTRAAGTLRARSAELETGERRARAELDAAAAGYEAVRGPAMDAWDATADLDSLVAAALASYQAGERTDTDLLEILASVREARLDALELYAAALASHRTLEEAAGRPLTAGASR